MEHYEMTGAGITAELVTEAARIERDKNGKALTPDEAKTLRAVDFLRKIAPYLFPVLALFCVSACHGIAPSTPSLIATTPASQVPTVLQVVPNPATLPIGGGMSSIRVAVLAGLTGARNTRVTLTASAGTLAHSEALTDAYGYASVAWAGTETGTITATAGALSTDVRIVVEIPVPLPVPSIPRPPTPQPLPDPPTPPGPPSLALTLAAVPFQVAAGALVTLTASVVNLNPGEVVTAYEWDWEGGTEMTVDETTVSGSRSHTYDTDGIRAPIVRILTSTGRSTSATGRVIVFQP